MLWQGLIFWYDNYGLWPWQAKPRPKMNMLNMHALMLHPSKKRFDYEASLKDNINATGFQMGRNGCTEFAEHT